MFRAGVPVFLLVALWAPAPGQWLETTVNLPGGSSPTALACNSANNKVYVADNAHRRVFVLDAATDSLVATVPTDSQPSVLCYNPTSNKIYCASLYFNNVTIIDGATDSVLATLVQKPWSYVEALCCIPESNKVYCPSRDSMMVIDGAADSIVARFALGSYPRGMCYNPANGKVYAACWGPGPGFVAVIDAASNQVIAQVGTSYYPAAICVNSRNDNVYCANYEWPAGFQRSTLSVIDGNGDSLLATVTFPDWSQPAAVCCNYTDNRVYCANRQEARVAVIDGTANRLTDTIPVAGPEELLFNPANDKVYCSGPDSVLVIAGWNSSILGLIPVGSFPGPMAWNPIQNRVYVSNSGSHSVSVLRDSATGIEARAPSESRRGNLTVSANPVRGMASIRFQVPAQGRVRLTVRDITGRTVVKLADGVMKPGACCRDWLVAPGTPAGIYFLALDAPGIRETRKLILAD